MASTTPIRITIVGDTDDAQKKIKQVDSSLANLGNSVSKGVFSRIGNVFASMAIGSKLEEIGKAGIKAAGDFQQTRIAFEGVLGSAQTANVFLGQLRDFAAKTPFEFPQLAKASQQLLRFSHLVPRSSDVSTRTAAAIALMRCGQMVTRSRARQRPSRALARSAGARSAVISSL